MFFPRKFFMFWSLGDLFIFVLNTHCICLLFDFVIHSNIVFYFILYFLLHL